MPDSIGAALDGTALRPSDLNDADGGPVVYRRLDDRTALLCAPNRRMHVVIRDDQVIVHPWPPGTSDPCRTNHRSEIGP